MQIKLLIKSMSYDFQGLKTKAKMYVSNKKCRSKSMDRHDILMIL